MIRIGKRMGKAKAEEAVAGVLSLDGCPPVIGLLRRGGGAKPQGLGLRKLSGAYWEIRAGLDRRVIFTLEGGLAVFILIGTHDDLHRILRR